MDSPTNNSNDNSISTQSTLNTDSTYIFGYSGEINEKAHLKYSLNNMVNLEFIKFMSLNKYNGSTYNSKVNKLKMRIMFDSINNKKFCFFTDEAYSELNSLIKAYNLIKNYVRTNYKCKPQKLDYVNDCTLLLQPIDSINFVIKLQINSKVYRFSSADLIQIYNHALKHIDQKAYINGELEAPKNPYTNIDFTYNQNLSIYQQLVKYYRKNKGYVPSYIVGFKECYFNTKDYFARFYNNIMNTSVTSYLNNCSYETFEEEFDEMVENLSRNTKDCYCAKCFKRHDLRLLFIEAVKTYILNSNDIYLYGYYETTFLTIAEANSLDFKPEHRLRHRKRTRSRRPRSRRFTNNNNSISQPFNFTFSTQNSDQPNAISYFRSDSSIFNNNVLSLNNESFTFRFNNVLNIDNVVLNQGALFNFSSPNNPIYTGSDNISFSFTNTPTSPFSNEARFDFNSPINIPQLNTLVGSTTTVINNDPPGDIGPVGNSLGNISELRLLTNQPFDEAMDLITSDSSIETPPITPENNSTPNSSNESMSDD